MTAQPKGPDMQTITPEQSQKITDTIAGMTLPKGLGDEQNACSIAAINLALTGELTDSIPACMSPAIGRWIIRTQDAMPADMRNSPEWRALLPLAAGTGRLLERERAAIVLDWLFTIVLPQLQSRADAHGYGPAWADMCQLRTPDACRKARNAAANANAADAADAANAAAQAADAADAFWKPADPIGCLRRMIEAGQ